MRVKICGLMRPEDAAATVRLGAWALGVIFAPESPRCVDADAAARVLAGAPAGVERVGVFVNAEPEEIAAAVEACGLTAVQLHGEESPGECLEVQKRTGCTVIKAFAVAGVDVLERVVQFDTDYVLLDTYHPERRGGTGEIFDWELAGAIPESLRSGRLILSGGLNAANIAEAIKAVRPFAVDVSSGVESSTGKKDHEKLKELFGAVKET